MKLTHYRNSETGRWCTKAYAKRNPATTEAEEHDLDTTGFRSMVGQMCHEMERAQPEDTAEIACEIVETVLLWRDEMISSALTVS